MEIKAFQTPDFCSRSLTLVYESGALEIQLGGYSKLVTHGDITSSRVTAITFRKFGITLLLLGEKIQERMKKLLDAVGYPQRPLRENKRLLNACHKYLFDFVSGQPSYFIDILNCVRTNAYWKGRQIEHRHVAEQLSGILSMNQLDELYENKG